MTFQAALFDMDGTLIDSMGVWARVDEAFFARRGMSVPADYARAIAGLSFRQTGEYTKERFQLPESVDEILAEWNAMCEASYINDVPLKPGAKEYVSRLRRAGVRLAVATALPRHLYEPVLLRTGIYDLFDAFVSTGETGESKRTGRVYLLAAEKLGVEPGQCVVFEDILEGLLGAHAAGMKAVCVRDEAASAERPRALEVCDRYADDFWALLADLPDEPQATV